MRANLYLHFLLAARSAERLSAWSTNNRASERERMPVRDMREKRARHGGRVATSTDTKMQDA